MEMSILWRRFPVTELRAIGLSPCADCLRGTAFCAFGVCGSRRRVRGVGVEGRDGAREAPQRRQTRAHAQTGQTAGILNTFSYLGNGWVQVDLWRLQCRMRICRCEAQCLCRVVVQVVVSLGANGGCNGSSGALLDLAVRIPAILRGQQ
eukprot:45602-Pleurochrysis_carterae.AAC.1